MLAHVTGDGLLADEQLLRDLPVGLTARHVAQHLELAAGEPGPGSAGAGFGRRGVDPLDVEDGTEPFVGRLAPRSTPGRRCRGRRAARRPGRSARGPERPRRPRPARPTPRRRGEDRRARAPASPAASAIWPSAIAASAVRNGSVSADRGQLRSARRPTARPPSGPSGGQRHLDVRGEDPGTLLDEQPFAEDPCQRVGGGVGSPAASRSSASPGCGSRPNSLARWYDCVAASSSPCRRWSSASWYKRGAERRLPGRIREHRARPDGFVGRLVPAAVELEDLRSVDEAAAAERNQIRLPVAPRRQGPRPLPRPGQVADVVTRLDDSAGDDARDRAVRPPPRSPRPWPDRARRAPRRSGRGSPGSAPGRDGRAAQVAVAARVPIDSTSSNSASARPRRRTPVRPAPAGPCT